MLDQLFRCQFILNTFVIPVLTASYPILNTSARSNLIIIPVDGLVYICLEVITIHRLLLLSQVSVAIWRCKEQFVSLYDDLRELWLKKRLAF